MTDTHLNTIAAEPGALDYVNAAHEVLATLLVRMGKKKERKARAEIDRYIAMLETFGDERLPLNVVSIRRKAGSSGAHQRQLLAAAVRVVAAPVGCPPYKASRK